MVQIGDLNGSKPGATKANVPTCQCTKMTYMERSIQGLKEPSLESYANPPTTPILSPGGERRSDRDRSPISP